MSLAKVCPLTKSPVSPTSNPTVMAEAGAGLEVMVKTVFSPSVIAESEAVTVICMQALVVASTVPDQPLGPTCTVRPFP